MTLVMKVIKFILSFLVTIRALTLGKTCLGKKVLSKPDQIDDNYTIDYIRNLTCIITDTPKTYYKCKVACKQQQTCEAMRYDQSCELCRWTRQESNNVLDLNDLYITENILLIAQLIGKKFFLFHEMFYQVMISQA